MSELIARVKEFIETVLRFVEDTILWRIWERMLENEFIDRSVALAAKAFVSFFPALIVVAAFLPHDMRQSVLETVTRRTGLSGAGLDTVRGAFKASDDTRRATGIIGLVFTFFYINSFTTALRRVYVRAWRRPPGGRVAAYAIGASWLVAVIMYFALIGVVHAVLNDGVRLLGFGVITWLLAIGGWWLTPWFMLQRQVRLRVLSSTAIVTGTALFFYSATATLWMPRTVSGNVDQFGFFGIAIALVTWLTGSSIVIVVGAVLGPVLAEDDGFIGRLIRGGGMNRILAPHAKPALPEPAAAPRLVQAIGIRGQTDDEREN
jgi:membrane protein